MELGQWQRYEGNLEMSNSQPGSAGSDQAFGRFDDFTRINGITRTTAKALHAAEIHTFAQLAAMDTSTIAALVGGNPERIRGQDWTRQARELAAQPPGPAPEPVRFEPGTLEDEPNDQSTSQRRENFQLEFTLDAANIPRQTRVKHLQPKARKPVRDRWDDGWGGWDAQRLIDFFVTKGQIELPGALTDLASAERSRTADTVVQALQEWLAQEPLAVRLTPDTAPEWLRQMNQAPIAALQADLSRALQTRQAELARAFQAELTQALQAQVPAMEERLGELLSRQLAAASPPGLRAAEPTTPASVIEAALPAESNLQLQVLKITVGETPLTPEHQTSWASRLYAEVTFQLSGPADTLLELQQSPCHLQAVASETTTGDSTLLAATSYPLQPLEPPAPYPQRPGAFIIRSTGKLTFGLPRLGRHQLLVSVYLPTANLVAAGLSDVFSVVP